MLFILDILRFRRRFEQLKWHQEEKELNALSAAKAAKRPQKWSQLTKSTTAKVDPILKN